MDKTTLKVAAPNSWSDIMTDKLAKFFEKEHIQFAIRNKILDPILNYILNKIFPYIMLICLMFMLLLVSVIVTLCVMIFKFKVPLVPSVYSPVEKEIAL
jgi:uncharacterized membrane protein